MAGGAHTGVNAGWPDGKEPNAGGWPTHVSLGLQWPF